MRGRLAQIQSNRQPGATGWYDGPRVGAACDKGASRFWPSWQMTARLYLPFYMVVLLIILDITIGLPRR